MKIFITLTILSIIFLSVLYVYQTNLEVSERYLVNESVRKISELSEENKTLEIASAKSSSLDKLAGLVDSSDYERITRIQYIKVLNGYVVAK